MDPKSEWQQGVYDTGEFKTRPFAVHETYFCKMNFHSINNHMQDFHFPACRKKGTPQWTQKVKYTMGCMTLGTWDIHIGTLAIHKIYFVKVVFHLISKSHSASFSSLTEPGGYQSINVIGSKTVYYSESKLTYDNALNKCKEVGSGLVEIKTEKEFQEVGPFTLIFPRLLYQIFHWSLLLTSSSLNGSTLKVIGLASMTRRCLTPLYGSQKTHCQLTYLLTGGHLTSRTIGREIRSAYI